MNWRAAASLFVVSAACYKIYIIQSAVARLSAVKIQIIDTQAHKGYNNRSAPGVKKGGIIKYLGNGGVLLKIVNSIKVFKHYSYLLQQLVSRDFKVKYKRSVLGVAWSVLNPLFTMIILNVVFSQLFGLGRSGAIKSYPVYLLTGIVLFNYFSEATNLCNGAVVGNFNLLTKVYIPKYIFPLSKVLSAAINLLFSLLALYIIVFEEAIRTHIEAANAMAVAPKAKETLVLVANQVNISWTHLLLPYDLICMIIFCIGIGLFLSALTVFFRDMFYIWGVVLTAWNYLTPIMYPESIIAGSRFEPFMSAVYKINPLYYFIKYARTAVLDNAVPSWQLHVACLVCAFAMLIIGLLFFRKKQDKFIYYI